MYDLIGFAQVFCIEFHRLYIYSVRFLKRSCTEDDFAYKDKDEERARRILEAGLEFTGPCLLQGLPSWPPRRGIT